MRYAIASLMPRRAVCLKPRQGVAALQRAASQPRWGTHKGTARCRTRMRRRPPLRRSRRHLTASTAQARAVAQSRHVCRRRPSESLRIDSPIYYCLRLTVLRCRDVHVADRDDCHPAQRHRVRLCHSNAQPHTSIRLHPSALLYRTYADSNTCQFLITTGAPIYLVRACARACE